MTILEADHIQKRFAEKMVLKDISFSIEKPEIFGLLGPSGSGKTTLIRILLGLLKKDGGSSYVLGNDSGHLSDDTYAQIGMMLDEAGLYDRLSCIDNLTFSRISFAFSNAFLSTGSCDSPILWYTSAMLHR